jgi:hypothetical protein
MKIGPPRVLAGTEVLEYAIVDESVSFTGRLRLFHGDEQVGPVPRLAICKPADMPELLVFHCDEEWNVLGIQAWNSPDRPTVTTIPEVKTRMERYYAGISAKWRKWASYDA